MRKKILIVILCTISALSIFAQAFASDVALAWDPVTSSALAGYKLYYGTAPSNYGSSVNVGNKTSYTVSGLQAGTTYYFAVTAYDSTGKETAYSNETSATIPQPAPVISGVQATIVASDSATVHWTTDLSSDSDTDYGTTTTYGKSASNATMVTSHNLSLSGLSANTLYHYRVVSKTSSGGQATAGDFTFTTLPAPDTTAPVISAVASSGITSSSAVISWTTNEGSKSQVQYGITTAYGSSTTANSSLATVYSQSLSGLQASTLYHYQVLSTDAAGNTATSGDFTFTTAAAPSGDTTPPVISAVASSNITYSSAVITWTTNEGSTSQVQYGTTTAYGSSTTANSSLITAHSQTLSGLQPNTTYHYCVVSTDAAGNTTRSGDFVFRTAKRRGPK